MPDSSGRRVGRVAGHPKFEQDLSKESGSNRAIFEEKTEESAVRTIESKGFLQTSPLPLGYRALDPKLALYAKKVHPRQTVTKLDSIQRILEC